MGRGDTGCVYSRQTLKIILFCLSVVKFWSFMRLLNLRVFIVVLNPETKRFDVFEIVFEDFVDYAIDLEGGRCCYRRTIKGEGGV